MFNYRKYWLFDLKNGYEVDKQWLKDYLQSLYEQILSVRKKSTTNPPQANKSQPPVEGAVGGGAVNAAGPTTTTSQRPLSANEAKKNMAEERLMKKEQEIVLRKMEKSLFEMFKTSPNPYLLNLLMIETSRDYTVNKYNTLACTIAKSFEKWHSSTKPSSSSSSTIDNETRIDAFVVATKYNLMILDYVVQPYQMTTNNNVLLPFVHYRMKTLDYKDKAVLICSLMMQHHFDCEEVRIKKIFK